MLHYSELLKNRQFVLYNTGQMLAQFADSLIHIVLIAIVYVIAPGSTVLLAKTVFFTVLPSFIISPIAGVYVDRLDRRRVLIVSNLIRGLIVIAIPLFMVTKMALAPIYFAVFVIFASACFFIPAKWAIVPDLVDKRDLLMANTLSTASWTVAGVAGFTSGAFLIELFGITNGLFLTALLYLLSAGILFFLRTAKKIEPHKFSLKEAERDLEDAVKKTFLRDMKEGFLYLISHKNAKMVVGIFFVLMSVVGSLYVVTVVFVQEVTGSVTSSLGILGAFLFFGFLAGSYIYGKFGHKFSNSKMIFAAFGIGGLLIVSFPIIMKTLYFFAGGCAVLFSLGVIMSPIASSGNTIIHKTIDKEMSGRVFSTIGIIMGIGFAAFMFISSWLAEYIGREWVIILCGAILSLVGFIDYRLNKKEGFISS